MHRNKSNEIGIALRLVFVLVLVVAFSLILTISTDPENTLDDAATESPITPSPTNTRNLETESSITGTVNETEITISPEATKELYLVKVTRILPTESLTVILTATPAVATDKPTSTSSVTPSLTNTSTATPTQTPSFTPTITNTMTSTPSTTVTSSHTSTIRPSATSTQTPSPTSSSTPTVTWTMTATPTKTSTATLTAPATPSAINTPTATSTDTPQPTELNDGHSSTSVAITRSSSNNCLAPDGWVTYTIQNNDTLYSLAQSVDLTVDDLAQANCLEQQNLIIAGAVLSVPFTSATSANATQLGQITLNVRGCNNPFVNISYPRPGEILLTSFSVRGTANIPAQDYFKLEVRGDGKTTYQFWSRSNTPVTDAQLGVIDTTSFSTGLYWIRLVAVTITGNVPQNSTCEIPVILG